MSGLTWLNDLMIWLAKWVPRPLLIKATHIGVRFGHRNDITAIGPSLCWYWPITTEVVLVSTRERTSEIATQLCGRDVVSIAVQYTISDPALALQSLNDVFATLDDRAQAALSRCYSEDATSAQIAENVQAMLVDEFCPSGVLIHRVSMLQRGRAIPLKNLNDWAQHAKAVLE